MIEKISNLLATFSQEAQVAAASKCAELGYDPNRGRITFDESYINLRASCDILRDAIDKQKLIQLPITVQDVVVGLLESISNAQTNLTAGTDEVEVLVSEIEKLNAAIWQYGLHNLSEEVLGYQAKLNALKNLELTAIQTMATIKEGAQLKEQMDLVLNEAKAHEGAAKQSAEVAVSANLACAASLDATNASSTDASEVLALIKHTEKSARELLDASVTSNEEIQQHCATINGLVVGFTTLKSELETNKATQIQLFAAFEKHREKVNELLGDANRTGMAASFTARRTALRFPMAVWAGVFGVAIIGLSILGLVYIEPLIATAHWEHIPAKLALTAPLIWLGWFAVKQYGYTTRLREDYAYKEASAKSFEGYKREAGQVDAEMLKRLLETAIENLGQNPIRIYDTHDNHGSPMQELFEKATKDDRWLDVLKGLLFRDKK
ncbi:MAG: hypothetical protein ACKVQK_26415 [Burkholderiales bacterium]